MPNAFASAMLREHGADQPFGVPIVGFSRLRLARRLSSATLIWG